MVFQVLRFFRNTKQKVNFKKIKGIWGERKKKKGTRTERVQKRKERFRKKKKEQINKKIKEGQIKSVKK